MLQSGTWVVSAVTHMGFNNKSSASFLTFTAGTFDF